LAHKVVASFFGTAVKAVANDVAWITAALDGFKQAAWTFLGTHQSYALGAAVGAEQAPLKLSVASAVRVRPPLLHATPQLHVPDGADAAAATLNFTFHAATEQRGATAANCYGKGSRCYGSIEPPFDRIAVGGGEFRHTTLHVCEGHFVGAFVFNINGAFEAVDAPSPCGVLT
jgi:hypothetical protein